MRELNQEELELVAGGNEDNGCASQLCDEIDDIIDHLDEWYEELIDFGSDVLCRVTSDC